MRAALLAAVAVASGCQGDARSLGDDEQEPVLPGIEWECGFQGRYYLSEQYGEIHIFANPAIRQLPLAEEKVECARRLVRERLGRELAEGARAAAKSLIFVFPDGIRGRGGKIQGTAEPSVELARIQLDILRDCGAENVRWGEQVTHHDTYVADSTANDRAVVACLQRNVSSGRRFHVYLGSPRRRASDWDDSAFREFWAEPEMRTET